MSANKTKDILEPAQPVPEHFIDGIANIGLSHGVVRIDFAHLSGSVRADSGHAALERNVRLITSVEGFVAAYQTMHRMIDRLAKQGKIAVATAPRVFDVEDRPASRS